MTLNIQIDFRSGTPIYIQIMEQIRNLVVNGDLKVGDQLPTVRQLATDLRINFNTVARAYRMLDEARLISTQQGRGTYIWEEPSDEIISRLRSESLQGLTERYLAQARKMGYSPDETYKEVYIQLRAWREGLPPPDSAAED
jgi:GntR family transcriptional regulator